MKKFTLKRLLIAALCLTMILAVAGCGSSSGSSGGGQAADAVTPSSAGDAGTATSGDKVKLNVWHQWTVATDGNRIALEQAMEEYIAANPNVEIETNFLEGEAYKSKISTEFAGSASAVDVFFYWGAGRAGKLQQAGKLLPIGDYLTDEQKNTIKPGADTQFKYGDKLFGTPLFSWVLPVYCNTELFEKAGVALPTNYDEWLDACVKLKESGVDIPLAMGIKDSWQAAFVYEAIALREVGAENENKMLSGEIPFEDPGYLEAAKKVKEMFEAGAFGPNPIELSAADADQAYLTGKAAMRMTGSWFTDSVYTDKNSVVQEVTTTIMIPLFSKGKDTDYMGGFIDGFFVNNNTANPEVAADFTFYISKAIGKARHESGQGFTAFTEAPDESGLFPVGKEIAEMEKGFVDGVIAWDTFLDANTAAVHLESVQALFTAAGDPQTSFEEHQDAIN